MSGEGTQELVASILGGDSVAVGRGISLIEDRTQGYRELLKQLYAHSGSSTVVGITGPPGSGKSTLVNVLVDRYLEEDHRPGVVAVDPSSPFSGGSVLGDRIRFDRDSHDDVFFRSMSARGTAGGLALSTNDAIRVLDAAGYDPILVETVGAGQNEIDVVRTADSVVVVMIPSAGDDVQMLKAGILEIGELFVVNKMDLEGADRAVVDLKEMIRREQRHSSAVERTDWDVPVVKTNARTGENVTELRDLLGRHRQYLRESGAWDRKRRRRRREELRRLLREDVERLTDELVDEAGGYDQLVDRIVHNGSDPYSVVESLTSHLRS